MKIAVYKIEKVTPSNIDEQEDLCDIFNTPSLRSGYVEMIGSISHFITKSELNKMQKVYAKFYNKETKTFIEGVLIIKDRTFAAYCK